MRFKLKYLTLCFILFTAVNSYSKNCSLLRDSVKARKENSRKMEELSKMLELVKIGNKAPEFRYVSIKKDSIQLSSFKGKIVVIDYWATWCPPCVAQIPYYEAMKVKFSGKEVVFLSVSLDHSKSKWERFLSKRNNITGHQLWSGQNKPAYYFTLMDYETMKTADPISGTSKEVKSNLTKGIYIYDGVPGNFVIIDKDGNIASKWLLPSLGTAMEDKINELLIKP